jgi:hypothetical protein
MRFVGPVIAAAACMAGLSGCIEANPGPGPGERYIAAPYRADARHPAATTIIAEGEPYVPSPAAFVEMPTATW